MKKCSLYGCMVLDDSLEFCPTHGAKLVLVEEMRPASAVAVAPSAPVTTVAPPGVVIDLTGTECPNCKANVPAKAKFCLECGQPVETPEQLRAQILQLTGELKLAEDKVREAEAKEKGAEAKVAIAQDAAKKSIGEKDAEIQRLQEELAKPPAAPSVALGDAQAQIVVLEGQVSAGEKKYTDLEKMYKDLQAESRTFQAERDRLKAEMARPYTVDEVNRIVAPVCAEFEEVLEGESAEQLNARLGEPAPEPSDPDVLQLGEAGQPAGQPEESDLTKAIEELKI